MPSRTPQHRLRDILDNIRWIQSDTETLSEADFLADRTRQDAVLFCMLRISEAASKMRGVVEALAPDQPWHRIRTFGNVLRHEYEGIDLQRVWQIV